ncbi:MAG: hypothetical protein ACR2QW_00385 [bacterium]
MVWLVVVTLLIAVSLPWILPKIFDLSSRDLGRKIPELKNFPVEQRGRVWFEAICKALLQWQVMLTFLLALSLAAILVIFLDGVIFRSGSKSFQIIVVAIFFFAAMPMVKHRARKILST